MTQELKPDYVLLLDVFLAAYRSEADSALLANSCLENEDLLTIGDLRGILAQLAERERELAEAHQTLRKIGASGPNHCVCCTHMGRTARAFLASKEQQ